MNLLNRIPRPYVHALYVLVSAGLAALLGEISALPMPTLYGTIATAVLTAALRAIEARRTATAVDES